MAAALPEKRLGRLSSSVFIPEPELVLNGEVHRVKVEVLPVGFYIEVLDTSERLPVSWEEFYKLAVGRREFNVRLENAAAGG